MARFRVRGESTVLWELELEAEDTGPGVVAQAAKEYVNDMLDLTGIGTTGAKIESQEDRILRIHEINEMKEKADAGAVKA